MAVPSGTLKHKYPGNGVQEDFDFDFKIISKDVLLVQKQVGNSLPIDLVVDVDYSVTGLNENNGGSVHYPLTGDKLADGDFLIIKPNYPYTQGLTVNRGTLPSKDVENQFDIVCMQIKQLADELSRALQISENYDGDAESFIELVTSTSYAILAGLSGTSTTSLSISLDPKTFVTQSGKFWVLGQRIRAASDDGSIVMEGPVTDYTGTSLTLDVDFKAGSGTHADWNISLTGERGKTGAGSGDMLAEDNLSDVADAATAFDNIKQAATTSYTGVSRFATEAEAQAGVLDNVAITPATLVSAFPSAVVVPYAGSSAPAGWQLCYGQAISRTTYANLYAAIGTTYGTGDGSTTFNLPDMRGRVAAGQDDMGGTAANRLTNAGSGITGTTLGDNGGAETHTLTTAQMPSHHHDGSSMTTSTNGDHNHGISYGASGSGTPLYSVFNTTVVSRPIPITNLTSTNSGSHSHTITGNTGDTGAGSSHNNVQPTIILNYIIKE